MKKRDLRLIPAAIDLTPEILAEIDKLSPQDNQAGQNQNASSSSKKLLELVTWIDSLYKTSIYGSANDIRQNSQAECKSIPVAQALVDAFIHLTPAQINLLLAIQDSAYTDLDNLLPLSLTTQITFGLLPEPIKGLIWPYVTFFQPSAESQELFN